MTDEQFQNKVLNELQTIETILMYISTNQLAASDVGKSPYAQDFLSKSYNTLVDAMAKLRKESENNG